MLRHIGANVRDLVQAKAYYDMLMPLLGFEPHIAAEDQFAYRPINNEPGTSLFFYPALEQSPYSRHYPGLQHLAFMVESRAAVHAVHTKVLVLGSEVVHSPQVFPQYRPYYFATFLLEAVCLREEEGTESPATPSLLKSSWSSKLRSKTATMGPLHPQLSKLT